MFRLLDTHGIPLEMTLDKLNESNMICDWVGFWNDGVKAGWPPNRIMITLTSAIGDVYGPDFREEWEFRMKAWIRLVGKNEA